MVKKILADAGDSCEVDVDVLHDRILLELPAGMYLELYHKMQRKVLGEPYWGCNCGTPITESETE
ncbi:MAG: hypothetical protein HDR01_05735 [Lachnospiraceae bacterium]|nr:hypothetical protein [Lachnospiraceae bacterium]